jgi:hypothetical protein
MDRMRLSFLFALAWVLFAAATATATAAPTSLDITARNVDFYYNRFIVTADGDVRVRLSDGTTVSGQTFTMDLKLNRYLVAGNVHLDGPTIHQTGAALAGYPDLDRTFFLPEGVTPIRYTYFGADWTNPHPGREQPGDAFNFPDLTGERPYIKAIGVRIVPKTNALFAFPRIYTAGIYTPLPRYVVTFSANPHYFENAFAGGRFDVGIPFNGSEHSLTALHVRNDQFNGTYLAFDQHFVWDKDYIVFAVDPLTQEQRQYNLIGYKRFSPGLESRLFLQESAGQPGIINRPINAAGFGEIQINGALHRSGLSYTQDNYYQYLLGFKAPADDTVFQYVNPSYDPRWREHPVNGQLLWTGFENRISKSIPILFRLRSGAGFAHDIYGEGGYPNEQPGPPDSFYHKVGGTIYTPAVKIAGGFRFSVVYDREHTWFNLPHQIDTADTRLSLSNPIQKLHLNTFLTYEVKNTSDLWGAQQLAAYPVGTAGCGPTGYGDTCVTQWGTFSGQDAFRGLATLRGLTAGVVYTPTASFAFSAQIAKNRDFPAPVPGIYGQPPYQLVLDLRARVSRQILVDFTRSYYFNFANERWTPELGIQFSP